ncbi:MAG: long-chain fatty acid--CoA ligase [Myxococcales bacterium]|nr:long-chain fatty acid--CoA ligase [Myxococcales bacterium]
MTALDQLRAHITARPEAIAFTLEGSQLTFGELDAAARRYAAGLAALGIARGDRVACLLGTRLELVIALLGAYYAGAVHVPINTRYGQVEIEHILRDSGARAVLIAEGSPTGEIVCALSPIETLQHLIVLHAAAEPLSVTPRAPLNVVSLDHLLAAAPMASEPRCDDEDPAMFIYTSGTTGQSKGVVLPYRAIVANIDALTRLWRWREDDRLVLALPLFHVHGLCIGVHGTLLRGCVAELHRRFDPDAVIQAIAAGGTIFMGVPTMYTRLLRALDADPSKGAALGAARLFTSGSAALSAASFEAFERHTGHRILERYGMSETLLTVSNPYPPEERKPGTIGFPVASGEVLVVDEEGSRCAVGEPGEIVVRGDSVMQRYWNAPEKTAASFRDGWFLTGDVARYDDEGYIVHMGRRSVDMIKSGGYRISAREIEECVALHPDIEEVAVVGRPDPEWGQRIAAALVTRGGAAERSPEAWAEELRGWLEGRLASYKRPRQVMCCGELPRNALGKIQKHLLAWPD